MKYSFICVDVMIISFVSQKGGSGKTTLCVNLAALSVVNGVDVAIIDLDPQASASSWGAVRGGFGVTVISCHPPLLRKEIERLKTRGVELILIDTPPHNSTAAANAIMESDVVVVPIRPSCFDLVATTATFDLLGSNKGKACCVLNAIPPLTKVATGAEEFLNEIGFEVKARIGQRICIPHALTAGRGVVEIEPKSTAANEITQLWNKIVEEKV